MAYDVGQWWHPRGWALAVLDHKTLESHFADIHFSRCSQLVLFSVSDHPQVQGQLWGLQDHVVGVYLASMRA